MRRPLAFAALAAAAAACARDLSVPSVNPLAFEQATYSAAPRQRLTLAAQGGAGGYRYAFAAGGELSGTDAALDASSGQYQAGAAGSAQDVVQVTDAAGAVAVARVAVSARLALTPALALTAPGGAITFTATGGRPTYAFALAADPQAAPGSGGSVDAATGAYLAGPSGDAKDLVVATDGTGDLAARAVAQVQVGPALHVYRAGAGAVAPNDTVALVALGGQAGYAWSMAANPSGGSVDATGTYRAGALGNQVDRVRVTDAFSQSAGLDLPVGAPLAAALPTAKVRPGVPVRIDASGGKPPYAFAFAAKGNRSGGSVDPVTGVYVPGVNVGASDLLVATDATGATAAPAPPPTVAPLRITLPHGAIRGGAGDFNGDGRSDLVFREDSMPGSISIARFTTAMLPTRADLRLETYWGPGQSDFVVADVDGDGRQDLFLASDLGSAPGAQALLADFSGHLALGPFVYNDLAMAPARSTFGSLFVYEGQNGACPSGRGVVLVTWQPSTGALARTCVANDAAVVFPVTLVAGDFNQDGWLDVAWLGNDTFASLHAVLGGSAGWGAPFTIPLPAGTSLAVSGPSLFTVASVAGGSGDDLVALVRNAAGRTGVALLPARAAQTFAWSWGPIDPLAASAPPLTGLAGCPPLLTFGCTFAGWNGRDGSVVRFRLTSTGLAAAGAIVFDYPVSVAVQADVNGDGVLDLAAGSAAGGATDLLWGDGGGTYAQRPRFGAGPFAVADVDGDGTSDVIAATTTPGLSVLYGGDHQLARGPETLLPGAVEQLLAGDFTGRGAADVIYQDRQGGLFLMAGSAGGAFAAPAAITAPGGGTDTALLGGLSAVDWGGAAPGPDLLGAVVSGTLPARSFQAVLVVRDTAGTARRLATAAVTGFDCAFQPVGGSAPFLAAVCCSIGAKGARFPTVWRSAVTPGATPVFGAWSSEGGFPANTPPIALGQAGGQAWFAVGTALFAVGPSAPATVADVGVSLTSGRVGPVEAPGALDVVGSSSGTVYLWKGGPSGPRVTASAPGQVGGIQPQEGGPADVLLFTGDEIVPLRYDAASGALQ